ncbi:RND family transporter [Mycobacterium spongiae]|uniref:MMPL family RND transporter n=1 Tax=Mycobacterium spongiae TaxID=886343 RepID=A0A975JXI8_9MYCO|nr:RND family transporter [Mycobacterium spongiae]QUR67530.1 MMPL family RND transporter [Mycobacterium spongiae]
MTTIARFIYRFAPLVIGAWILAAVVANLVAPRLEQLITSGDQPYLPAGTPTALAVQRSAEAFSQVPTDNVGYLVLQRYGGLDERDRSFYDHLVVALRADSRHVHEVVDWWGVPTIAKAAVSEDQHVATAAVRFSGMVGTTQASESITAARAIAAGLDPPDGLQIFITGPGATIMDEFAAIDRQTQLITATTLAALFILLLVLYRSLITPMVPLLSVVGAFALVKPVVSVLIQQGFVGVSLFSLWLSVAVVVGVGTGFSIFLIGRYHERRRQDFAPSEALADAYRGVAPAIVGSTLIVVTALGAVGWLSLARIGMFATTGVLCSIGVLAVGLAVLTLTPALIALASRAGLAKPPHRKRTLRRFRRLGTVVARWPAPILVGSGVFVLILLIALQGVPIGWDEAKATPRWAESNRGYQAVDDHFPPNQLLPDTVTIETDHDIRNPAGLTAIERITAAIMAIRGVRMVQSASHPTGLVSKQAAMNPSAGNIGDRLDEFSDQLASRSETFDNLETAANSMLNAVDLLQAGIQQGTYGVGQASLAVRLMQEAVKELRAATGDVIDIFDPLRRFTGAIPDCPTNAVCSAADEVVQWANKVVERSEGLADSARQLGQGIADAALAPANGPGVPTDLQAALDGASAQLDQMRASAAGLKAMLNDVGEASIRELPGYLHELAAVSQSGPGVDLYAARRILNDPKMRPVLKDFISQDGRATRLLVYGDGQEWGSDGAERARAIVAAVAAATKGGSLQPTAVELTGVGPLTRDLQDLVGSDLSKLAIITFAVIFVISALFLRSPVAGLILVGTAGTSYLCALGASMLIWRHILGRDLHWSVPPIAFVLVVAVGSTCNLLLTLRIREEVPAGPRTAIIRAFATTGALATIAGMVVGLAVAALAASSVLSVAQIGVAVGVGLVLDALVVRNLVLPALLVVLGRWSWWPGSPGYSLQDVESPDRSSEVVATSAM